VISESQGSEVTVKGGRETCLGGDEKEAAVGATVADSGDSRSRSQIVMKYNHTTLQQKLILSLFHGVAFAKAPFWNT
jgi:hypothetical protein